MPISSQEDILKAREMLDLGSDISDEQVDSIIQQTDKLAGIYLDYMNDKVKKYKEVRTKWELIRKGYTRKIIDQFLKDKEKLN